MKCPNVLEPHQIQGLDFIAVLPVIQWLVKESVKFRTEKAERLKLFAVGQFHNHFKLSSSEIARNERKKVLNMVREIDQCYAVKRLWKRKQAVEPEDEKSRVRLTLLEYGVRGMARTIAKPADLKYSSFDKDNLPEELEQEDEVCQVLFTINCFCMRFLFAHNLQIDVDRLLNDNLAFAKEVSLLNFSVLSCLDHEALELKFN